MIEASALRTLWRIRICVLRFTGYQHDKPVGAGAGLLSAGSLKVINAILGRIEPMLAA